jgi:peptidoglycan/xylan/chitin deacetylase (PgdA/CDA1 family)
MVYTFALVGAGATAYVGFDAWLSVTGRKTAPSIAERLIQRSSGPAGPVTTPATTNPEVISLVRSLRAADVVENPDGTTTVQTLARRTDSRANLVATADAMTKPIRSWPTGKNRIALTFDDGPHPTITPRLLELLKSKNVRATFFILGPHLQRHPHIGQQMLEAGMEVANHSMTHPTLPRKTEAQIRAELQGANDIIRDVLQINTTLMRPPYGATNQRLEEVCAEMGLKIVNWSVDTDDWRPNMTEDRMKKRIQEGIHDGAIILMHDRSEKVLNVTAWAIDEIRKQGFELVTVSELLTLKPQKPLPGTAEIAAAPVHSPAMTPDNLPTTLPNSTTHSLTASQFRTPTPASPEEPTLPAPRATSPDMPVTASAPTSPAVIPATSVIQPAPVTASRTRTSNQIEDANPAPDRPATRPPEPPPSPLDLPIHATPVPGAPAASPSPLAGQLPEDVLTPLPPSRP